MKKSSTDVVLTPVVDALIVVIMLVFMALLVYAGNKAPIIKELKAHEARIKQNGLGMSVLKITDPDADSLSIKFSRLYSFIDTTYSNDTLILTIEPLLTTERKLYDFTITASDKDYETKHRVMFEVIGEGQRGNNPPVINTITAWPKVIVKEKVEYAKLEIYDPDGDEINIDTDDLPDFIESEYNDGILTLAFKPTKKTKEELYDDWIRVNDNQNAFDSLRIMYDLRGKELAIDPYCGIKGSYTKISLHVFNENEIIPEVTPSKKGKDLKVKILDKKYSDGDFIGKFINIEEFKQWSAKMEEHGQSGDFGDVGKCKFWLIIYIYKDDTALYNKLNKIGSNHFYSELFFDQPLFDQYGIKNIKTLKKEIKKKIRWN